ncbi:hypothetical protein [Dyadobacter pollutisoli]|uniref:Uncharacterized protein n=1 Tax=Dyadobacter pollutisoli TaxID=2910158 RepID=A0A9E8SJW3_9BACT|nr:hypothetical protein [Dyadobacter pollutisoli]WAC10156.1 hypothetical protein ON006_20630 [Dyadobacter pollutisoli]
MRRILSILLLGLLLYNMVGYSVVYLSEEKQTVSAVGKDFIQQSSGTEDIVIKVPVAVPYQNNWEAPQPAQGLIEHEGRFYQMKSQQLVNDTLIVRCEYDQSARERFSDLASKINDQVTGNNNAPEKDTHSLILKNFLKEYMAQDRKHVFYVLEWTAANDIHFPSVNSVLPETHTAIPSPPPNLA